MLCYFTGNVYSFVHNKNGAQTLSQQSLEVIATDLTKAFSQGAATRIQQTLGIELKVRSALTSDQIQDVYVFTWIRMAHNPMVKKLFENIFNVNLKCY